MGDSYPEAEGVNMGDSSVATVVVRVVVSTVSFCFLGSGVTGRGARDCWEVSVDDAELESEEVSSAFRFVEMIVVGTASSSLLEESEESTKSMSLASDSSEARTRLHTRIRRVGGVRSI